MKKLHILRILTACLLLTTFKANAQHIEISDQQAAVLDHRMEIDLKIRATELNLGCNGQLKLEFALEGNDTRLILPAVIYTGKSRNLYERRNELLSSQYVLSPYHIENRVKANKTYSLDYTISIPYYPWMEHATLSMNEYLYNCNGDYQAGSRALIADINPLRESKRSTEWNPLPEVYRKMVCFLVPEVEEVKKRVTMIELHIDYPVNVYEVRPAFGDNAIELLQADKLMRSVTENELISIQALKITGYASPEGPYENNERLAHNRAEGFKRYLVNKYNSNTNEAYIHWVAEDWSGLRSLVIASSLPKQNEILSIIDDNRLNPDAKNKALQAIHPWSEVYKVILKELYPKLRRIELKVDYTVSQVNTNRARELLHTQPELLSLDEMYRVAKLYEPGSPEYLDVYRTAANQYPNDPIANNNAAAALMMAGDTEEAKYYMEKIEKSVHCSCINLGAYYYINGDLSKAEHYFRLAKETGLKQAEQNLRLLKENK